MDNKSQIRKRLRVRLRDFKKMYRFVNRYFEIDILYTNVDIIVIQTDENIQKYILIKEDKYTYS